MNGNELSEEEVEQLKKKLIEQLSELPENEVEALKAKIKDATKEELEAFLKEAVSKECLFCQIIAGKLETIKIYEDEAILAILDLYPAVPGHMLLLPKQHFQFVHELPDLLLNKLAFFVKIIEPILKELTGAEGISIYIAQGEAAQQRVPHLCINLIPRFRADRLTFEWPKLKIEKAKLEELAVKIREKAAKELRQKLEVEKAKETAHNEIEKIVRHLKLRLP